MTQGRTPLICKPILSISNGYENMNVYHKKYRKLIVNYMKFTYIIHNCSITMFKHWSPDIISFTSSTTFTYALGEQIEMQYTKILSNFTKEN